MEGDDQPAAEVAHREESAGEQDHHDHADREQELDLVGQAAAERPVAGRQTEDDDREQVEDPLDEHGPERPRQRDRAVDLQEVGPVDVAELGRDEAVHQPADEDDLRAVADLQPEARPPDEERPAPAAEREAEIEDEERGQQVPELAWAISAGSWSRWKPGSAR